MTDEAAHSVVTNTGESPASVASVAGQQRGIRFTIFVLVAFMLTVLLLFVNKLTTPRILSPLEMTANGAHIFDHPRILKDVSLISEQGEAVDIESLKGKWSLVFLGFTHCPDICPTTLSTLRDTYHKLHPPFREEFQVVLLSADPRRDTADVLQPYMAHFDPDFKALTGDFLQVKRLAGQLNMTFVKVMQDSGYTVDHSANIAIVNPYGHYHGFIKPPLESSRVQLVMQSIISQWQG